MNKKYKYIVYTLILIAIVGTVILTLLVKMKSGKQAMTLQWSDEFNGPNGSGVDSSKWVHDIGGDGWGNNEEEYYTDGTNNCYLEDGNLVIEAKKEDTGNNPYTSARIITKGKFDFKYGKIEMRAKIPYGQGIWPAFWMLGSDISEVGWPDCGEIDIMENIGKEPNIVHGTLHGPGYSGAMGIGLPFTQDQPFYEDFHTYSVEWRENKIDWYVDGTKYHTMDPDKTIGNEWVFNENFFLLINLAVGGNWPGYPDETTVFPQKYLIDYVRVYR